MSDTTWFFIIFFGLACIVWFIDEDGFKGNFKMFIKSIVVITTWPVIMVLGVFFHLIGESGFKRLVSRFWNW